MPVVVLDVAGAAVGDRRHRLHLLDLLGALELGQDRLDRATEVVGEDGEAAAVGHAENDLFGAGAAGEGGQLVEGERAAGVEERGGQVHQPLQAVSQPLATVPDETTIVTRPNLGSNT